MGLFHTLSKPLGSRQEMKMCWSLVGSGLGHLAVTILPHSVELRQKQMQDFGPLSVPLAPAQLHVH